LSLLLEKNEFLSKVLRCNCTLQLMLEFDSLCAFVPSISLVTHGDFLCLMVQVHRVLIDIVSSAANATRGLGRYPPFKREVWYFIVVFLFLLDTCINISC